MGGTYNIFSTFDRCGKGEIIFWTTALFPFAKKEIEVGANLSFDLPFYNGAIFFKRFHCPLVSKMNEEGKSVIELYLVTMSSVVVRVLEMAERVNYDIAVSECIINSVLVL